MSAVLIIAEAGVNHNGCINVARKLIDTAADAGANVVKFQSFNAELLATTNAGRAKYQIENMRNDGSQQDMLRALELSAADHQILHRHCEERQIAFLSTAFDFESLEIVLKLNPRWIKIPSGDITFGQMLLRAAHTRKHIILSTGMADLEEIADALAVIAFGLLREGNPSTLMDIRDVYQTDEAHSALRNNVTILHCVTMYPCPPDQVNLAAMDSIRAQFSLPVGYSDHSLGIAIPIAAAARGATIIEKHLTLDRNMPGPDHAASLEPAEFKAMVAGIREVEQAIGHGQKLPTPVELENRKVARRSLVAARAIASGQRMALEDVAAKRPSIGVSPMRVWEVAGTVSDRDYAVDDNIAL